MGTLGRRLCAVLLVSAVICSFGYSDSKDLSLIVRPAFEGSGRAYEGLTALIVEVANRGPNAKGSVTIGSELQRTVYPIDLPRGSKKRFFAYVPMFGYGEESIVLDTDQGEVGYPLTTPSDGLTNQFALIGGSPGDLTMLRERVDEYSSNHDVYGKPGSLPDRSVGYSSIRFVVLGEGSERMTDVEVKALKNWVVTGGVILFTGGASSPVLNDSRWKGFLPVTNLRQRQLSSLPGIQALAGSPAPAGPFSATVGDLTPGSRSVFRVQGSEIVARKRIALGYTVFLGIDPLERRIKQWKGSKKLILNAADLSAILRNEEWLRNRYNELRPVDPYGYMPTVDAVDDPFAVSAPDTGTILLILLAHLILVVPVNFIVLRRMNKSELIWLTTPLISVVFAGILLSFSSSLYGAGQTTRATGLLIVSETNPTSYFLGSSELFIPRGGGYDLAFRNAESLVRGYEYGGDFTSITEIVDDGNANIPNYRASNLAFEQFDLIESLPRPDLLVTAKKVDADTLAIQITNKTGFNLSDVSLQVSGKSYGIETLAAGGTFSKDVVGYDHPHHPWADESIIVVSSMVEGLRPGPRIGDEKGTQIRMFYFGGTVQ